MGRKKIFQPENLEVGQRLELKGSLKAYVHQYAYQFNKRLASSGMKFRAVNDGKKVYVERIE